MGVSDLTPIIVGVGQAVSHWDGEEDTAAPSPLSLALISSQAALEDAGPKAELLAAIDTVVFVRLNQDSVPFEVPPNLHNANLPGSLAKAVDIKAGSHVYSCVGGEQPQLLVNEYCEALFNGSVKAVLLCGAEAMGAVKTARRKGTPLDWQAGPNAVPNAAPNAALDDRGMGSLLLSGYEITNGLGFPVQTYPVFDNAYRHRCGLTREDYQQQTAALFAPFSKIASQNPYSQFSAERTAEFLGAESKDNYRLTDSYLKWHVAQDAVNQSASVILTTVGMARGLGIPEDKWVFLHGYAQAQDVEVSRRADLSRSKSMQLSLERALSGAETQAQSLSHFDLYSCFPSVVFMAAEALGINWREKQLTVTGGLPYFGGAGNNYSLHAIAAMVERLRGNPQQMGLVLANGGFLSKHAAGIYSARPKENWKPISSADLQTDIDASAVDISAQSETDAVIESFSLSFGKSGAERGMIFAQTPSGRKLARFKTEHLPALSALMDTELIGRKVTLIEDKASCWVGGADWLSCP